MKQLFKKGCRAVALILMAPFGLLARVGTKVGLPFMYLSIAQLLSLIPGQTGIFIRGAYYRMTLKGFGKNTIILMGSVITKRNACIGDWCGIGTYTNIGWANIGDKAVIANSVSILSGGNMHDFSDPSKGPLETKGSYRSVEIGERCFIGDRSVIMANVGEAAVIGAGSVVVKDIEDMVFAVGNPARVIKKR